MGFSGIGIWELVIIFLIILLIFGGKRLRNLGGDLGTMIRDFKDSIGGKDNKSNDASTSTDKTEHSVKSEDRHKP
ncbi:MAG: twin-arginine translocase TatA/TatE family subunit [Pseudomonadota bacterium]